MRVAGFGWSIGSGVSRLLFGDVQMASFAMVLFSCQRNWSADRWMCTHIVAVSKTVDVTSGRRPIVVVNVRVLHGVNG